MNEIINLNCCTCILHLIFVYLTSLRYQPDRSRSHFVEMFDNTPMVRAAEGDNVVSIKQNAVIQSPSKVKRLYLLMIMATQSTHASIMLLKVVQAFLRRKSSRDKDVGARIDLSGIVCSIRC